MNRRQGVTLDPPHAFCRWLAEKGERFSDRNNLLPFDFPSSMLSISIQSATLRHTQTQNDSIACQKDRAATATDCIYHTHVMADRAIIQDRQ